MTFKLGCTEKSLIPAGVAPGGAVSPLGLALGFRTGCLDGGYRRQVLQSRYGDCIVF